jgi:shikimate kinase
VSAAKPLLLVGMMGAGKSSVGAALAQRLGRPFLDSDEQIERLAGKPIARIFDEEGEAAFRELEARVVEDLSSGPPVVAALGGGAIAQPGMAERVARRATVIYLRASPEQLLDRIGDPTSRPLLRGLDREDRLARLRAFAAEREASYLTARVVIETDGATIAQVVSRIAHRLVAIEGSAARGTSGGVE